MEKILWGIVCQVFMLLGFSNASSPEAVICLNGWLEIHRRCYMFIDSPDTWNNANAFCKSQQGNLVTLQSSNEKKGFDEFFKNHTLSGTRYWAGFTRDSESGADWKWIDGLAISASEIDWRIHSLQNRKGNYCGMLDTSTVGQVRLTNAKCSQENSFICEYPSSTKSPNVVGTTPLTINHGATITDTGAVIDNAGDGSILGVGVESGQKTSVTGGLYNSMKTVLSNSDQHTPARGDIIGDGSPTAEASAAGDPIATVATLSEEVFLTQGKLQTAPTTLKPLISEIPTTETHDVILSGSSNNAMVDHSSFRSQTPLPTLLPTQPMSTPKPTMIEWEEAFEEYAGCYIPSNGGSLRDMVQTARRLYPKGKTSCPKVKTGTITWPEVDAGKEQTVKCARRQGSATFRCGTNPTCWTGRPNFSQCVSKNLQAILEKTAVPDSRHGKLPEATLEETVEISSALITVSENEATTMEDVMVTSQALTAVAQIKFTDASVDKKQVETIIGNVVKVGSALVSTNKSQVWEVMSQEDRVRSASSLLLALETATASMAEQINEPTVINKKNDNIELEVRVVDLEALQKQADKIVYNSEQSENLFSIPIDTLKELSKGRLARSVFIIHYSMSELLRQTTPKDVNKHKMNHTKGVEQDVDVTGNNKDHVHSNEERRTQIVSNIMSATVGGSRSSVNKLSKSVSFTMAHRQEIDAKYITLCSFWDVRSETQLGFWSQDGCRVVSSNKSHTTCECDHMTNFAILMDVHGMQMSKLHQSLLRLVTIIGCVISCIALLASLITFQCFPSLQGERNSIHKNLAFTLLIAEILFVFGIDQARHQIVCSVIAGFLHFFFLAAFTWMFIEGIHIIFMLVQVFDASRSRLPFYYLAGYGAPLTVVAVSCLSYYKGYGTDKYCWLTTDYYFIWAFAGPVAIILLVNAIFLTYALSTVCRHSDYVFNAKEKSNGSGIRAWVQGALALEVLLGLTWTLGYFLINDDSLPLAYVFAILNSLQGLFIFIFHCALNKKAQKEYRQVVGKMVKRTPSSITTQSTITKRTNHTNNSHELNNSPSNSHQKLNATNSHSLA